MSLVQAAAYLGLSIELVKRLVKAGRLAYIDLSGTDIGKNLRYRFLLSDLNEYLTSHKVGRHSWHEGSETLPYHVVAKLLDISFFGVNSAIIKKTLKDTKPATVRAYIKKQYHDELTTKIRAKYKALIRSKEGMIHDLRCKIAGVPRRKAMIKK